MSTELSRANLPPEAFAELSIETVVAQVQKIQELMSTVMIEGEHFGTIPGTDKPTLLKAGAEKLGFVFRLAADFEVKEKELPGLHREYQVVCRIRHLGSDQVVGQGVGIATTMESKYRYRKQFTETEVGPLPSGYWEIPKDKQKERDDLLVKTFGPGRYRRKKVDEQWKAFRTEGDGERVENPDIADCYNTVLKIGKKRAHVDAIITVCAASDIFTQDLDDLIPDDEKKPATGSGKQKPAAAKTPSPEPRNSQGAPSTKPAAKPGSGDTGADTPPKGPFAGKWNRARTEITRVIGVRGDPGAWQDDLREDLGIQTLMDDAKAKNSEDLLKVADMRVHIVDASRLQPEGPGPMAREVAVCGTNVFRLSALYMRVLGKDPDWKAIMG